MIFGLQSSGRYSGDVFYNSLEYLIVYGRPGDRVVVFDHQFQGAWLWEEFTESLLDKRPTMGGSAIDPLLWWYFEQAEGENLTILSNGVFNETHIRKPSDFESYVSLRFDNEIENVTWFNPFYSQLGTF